MDPPQLLKDYKPQKDFFIGIDSDGCAFDTMEIKQKECFAPNTIKHWHLQAASKYVREAAEFVNLYSRYRGINRWPALTMVFDVLKERPEVLACGVKFPDYQPLLDFITASRPLSNITVKALFKETGNPIFKQALAWSEAVNKSVDEMVKGVPPFPYVKESLEKITPLADVVCVSATPSRALAKEWSEHGIDRYARLICGQEMGTKKDHLTLLASPHYPTGKILMIGDALGDLNAARAIGALFYPINPGAEDKSWQRFHEEASDHFFNGTYAGEYEALVIAEFEGYLPELPPWKIPVQCRQTC